MFSLRNRNETVYFLLSQCCLMFMCKIRTILLHVAILRVQIIDVAGAISRCDKFNWSDMTCPQ